MKLICHLAIVFLLYIVSNSVVSSSDQEGTLRDGLKKVYSAFNTENRDAGSDGWGDDDVDQPDGEEAFDQ